MLECPREENIPTFAGEDMVCENCWKYTPEQNLDADGKVYHTFFCDEEHKFTFIKHIKAHFCQQCVELDSDNRPKHWQSSILHAEISTLVSCYNLPDYYMDLVLSTNQGKPFVKIVSLLSKMLNETANELENIKKTINPNTEIIRYRDFIKEREGQVDIISLVFEEISSFLDSH